MELKQKKGRVALLLAFCLVFSLCACKKAETPAAPAPTEKPSDNLWSDVFQLEGHLSRPEGAANEGSLNHAAEKFRFIYDKYLAEAGGVYLSVIPDKNYYLPVTEPMDYDAFLRCLREKTDTFAAYVDLLDTLSADAYYKTDSHWRQECLQPAALRLAEAMGADIAADYEECRFEKDFLGVYARRSGIPAEREPLYYLRNDVLDSCTVYDRETDTEMPVYTPGRVEEDGYDLFLGGAKSLLRLKNPVSRSGKRLILFRDSFGSSLAPLLAQGYDEIILADIRYLASPLLGRFLTEDDFRGADVLFLYSASVLNHSETIK